MSNPYDREWVSESDEDESVTIVLDGPAQAAAVELCWEEIEENSVEVDYIERSALRIRAGARAACKRLRGERDAAIGVSVVLGRTVDNLAAERDDARLELRALEWLASLGYPVGRERGGPRVMAAYREADLEPDWHPSWSSAARALGWEG